MKSLEQIHREYENYREQMNANMGTTILTFEEWINYFLSVSKLSEEEYRKCYTRDEYLIEPKFKCEHD